VFGYRNKQGNSHELKNGNPNKDFHFLIKLSSPLPSNSWSCQSEWFKLSAFCRTCISRKKIGIPRCLGQQYWEFFLPEPIPLMSPKEIWIDDWRTTSFSSLFNLTWKAFVREWLNGIRPSIFSMGSLQGTTAYPNGESYWQFPNGRCWHEPKCLRERNLKPYQIKGYFNFSLGATYTSEVGKGLIYQVELVYEGLGGGERM